MIAQKRESVIGLLATTCCQFLRQVVAESPPGRGRTPKAELFIHCWPTISLAILSGANNEIAPQKRSLWRNIEIAPEQDANAVPENRWDSSTLIF
jgi:hypothetical protein